MLDPSGTLPEDAGAGHDGGERTDAVSGVVERVVVKMVMPNVSLCTCCRQNVPILRGAGRKLVRHEAPCGALCVGDQIGKPGVISEYDAPTVDPIKPYMHPLTSKLHAPHAPGVCAHCDIGDKATACPECGQSVGRYGEKLEDRIPHLAPCGRICHGSPHWATGGVHEIHKALECDDCAKGVKHPEMAQPQPKHEEPAPATPASANTMGKDETTMANIKISEEAEAPATKMQKAKAVVSNTTVNAAWRATTEQGVKAAQTILVNLTKRNVKDKGIRMEMARFLNSRAGEMAIAAAIALALTPAAKFDNDGDPINGAARISAELLTQVTATGMAGVMELFTGPLREGIGQILQGDIIVKLLNAPANEMPMVDFGAAVKGAVTVPASANGAEKIAS